MATISIGTSVDRGGDVATRDPRYNEPMWWAILVAGVAGVAFGAIRLVQTFRDGLRDRDVARTDVAKTLVQPAMFVTFGLFMTFLGLANVIAAGLVSP